MIHLAGFEEDVNPAGSFANIAALADQRLFTQGDDIRVPELNYVVALAGGADSSTTARVRMTSPTLDEIVRYDISPLNELDGSDVEPGSPQAVDDLRDNPLLLGVDEILQAEVLSTPAGNLMQWAFVWFADGPVRRASSGRGFTARATSSGTLTAEQWSLDTITLDENLPPGTYQVIGLRPVSAGMVAARVVFRTGNFYRPGALGCDAESDIQHPMFRHGGLGVWGEFPFTQIPAIEACSISGDSSQVYFLDLVRISR